MINALILIATLLGGAAQYSVDAEASSVNWTGEKIVGGGHTGNIQIKEGFLDFDKGELKGGSFVIDMTTINCTDLEGEYKGKLEGHLKHDDFFGVATYPTADFSITSVSSNGNGSYAVTGDLTIKGKTESISFETTVAEAGKNSYNATADITFDRAKFDVKYGSGSFFDNLGDKAISDDITLNVSLTASK